MSLCTDLFFINALRANTTVKTAVGNRIFDPARDILAEEEDKVPYIIVTYEGMQNIVECKDDAGESDEDEDTISVLIAADDREKLADLAKAVRTCIRNAMAQDDETLDFIITDYSVSANAVQMDIDKPCCYQTLTYKCETQNN